MGAPTWPPNPQRSSRPGKAVALLGHPDAIFAGMHTVRCRLSDALWHALQARHRATGESIDHMARAALADYLQVDHSTLFQISSSAALVEGIYKGEVTVGALREHGNFGLGTFAELDGEMIVVDGRFYQVRSDGVAREVDDRASTPFAVVTRFAPKTYLFWYNESWRGR